MNELICEECGNDLACLEVPAHLCLDCLEELYRDSDPPVRR